MEWYIKNGIENTWKHFINVLDCKTQVSTEVAIKKKMYRYLQVLYTIRLAQTAKVYIHNPCVQ